MKKILIKTFDKIVLLILSITGFFWGCDIISIGGAEYGTPYADFKLKGTVVNKDTKKPIQNIRVVSHRDTVYTNKSGKYELNHKEEGRTLYVKFEDIDGEDNDGYYLEKEIECTFTQEDKVEKGSGWYEGKYQKEQHIELEQKTDEENN
ncbi:radical SAM-associated putative lipoprotein [Paludibacter sp. 221]|uniref:radical SAM-associated putative lipoprotein n=1 Tax=Paludibacter sp. 221 TaxID=2302939 RepID=UPI0013CFB425|nr:radical SAM-associated putative lipoprotein [Paludibacter sp. 221]